MSLKLLSKNGFLDIIVNVAVTFFFVTNAKMSEWGIFLSSLLSAKNHYQYKIIEIIGSKQ